MGILMYQKEFRWSLLMKLKNKTADLVTFTEEIIHGKLHFLCSATYYVLRIVLLETFLETTMDAEDSLIILTSLFNE